MAQPPTPPDPARAEALAQERSVAAYAPDYSSPDIEPDEQTVHSRADLLPEEQTVGSSDPQEQARVILEESMERTEAPGSAPDTHLEHRQSRDAD